MAITCHGVRRFTGEDASMAPVPMVEMVVQMTETEAAELAAHKRERGRLSILADEARCVGEPVLDALVAAGVGE